MDGGRVPQEARHRTGRRGLADGRRGAALPLRRACTALGVATGGWYLIWRTSTLPGHGWVGAGFFLAEMATYLLMSATGLLVARKLSPRAKPGPPTGTLDVFVTVCGEPVGMVERTLRAALAIDYPCRVHVLNDGRIAGLRDWRSIDELALRMDVPCYTRRDGARGKAGNLNFALARTDGRLIATIDADHVARPDFAHATLGYFNDEAIGFVSTRQGFSTAAGDPLNNAEPLFYDYIQPAKDLDNSAFSCGNATVYRRAALLSVGGFSEWSLVEDLHTSYLLHVAGWHSVYHPEALTLGTAPASPSVFLHQRLRWATDSLRLLMWDNPLIKRGLSVRQRLHYLHTTTSYLIIGLQAVFALAPAAFVLGGVTLLSAAPRAYLTHALPYFAAVGIWLGAHLGPARALRVVQSGVFASPVYLFAALMALFGRPPPSAPTEKGRQRWFAPILVPSLLLCLLSCLAVAAAALGRGRGVSAIAVAWAAFQTFILLGPMMSRDRPSVAIALSRWLARALVVVVALALVPVIARQTPAEWELPRCQARLAAFPQPEPTPAPNPTLVPVNGAYIGISDERLPCEESLGEWRQRHGSAPVIVHWFQQWHGAGARFRAEWAARVAADGAIPMITWEPWEKPRDRFADPGQTAARLSLITDGVHDAHIRTWARETKRFGRPVLIRLMHEMNGDWYPWATGVNGNSPSDYVAAWRHVVDVFRAEGASNVSWVWSVQPVTEVSGGTTDIATLYPGDGYVDWVAFSAFNWGAATSWGYWQDASSLVAPTYQALLPFGKPIMIAEMGSAAVGGDASEWIRTALRELEQDYSGVKAVVWFSHAYSEDADFRLVGETAAALWSTVGTSAYWTGGSADSRARRGLPKAVAPVRRAAKTAHGRAKGRVY
jgi:cellulose synthase (UDP-forming)